MDISWLPGMPGSIVAPKSPLIVAVIALGIC
jgi:hypothetical protein